MKIMVCGSRDWSDGLMIRDVLGMEWRTNPTILHGDCRGADRIAAEVAEGFGFNVVAFPPDHRRPSPQRYHERNRAMLDQADKVIAFLLIGAENKGTLGVIKEANRRGIPVRTFEGEAPVESVHEVARGILRVWAEEDGTEGDLPEVLGILDRGFEDEDRNETEPFV